ncbi:MAG: TIGR03790 family protein [Planctomycetota bacterium]
MLTRTTPLDTAPRRARGVLLGLAIALLSGPTALAGGGPENLFLVVNELSEDSKLVANYYIRWRNVPDRNVLHVRWHGGQELTNVVKFRNQLLRPTLEAIEKRKLAAQIDYIVYAPGFPWRIDLQKDFPGKQFPAELRPVASLTGATYLWRYVMGKNPAIIAPSTNWYVPAKDARNVLRCQSVANTPSRAFRGTYRWSKTGARALAKADGQRYLLSTSLGVTTGRGNTVDEVLVYLKRAIDADHTHPQGTFYFARNNDVRSVTRHQCYRGVVQQLQAEGARAIEVLGTAPTGVTDVAGLTVGSERSALANGSARVLPGAICEHLTSFGGVLTEKPGHQMPLTDFLRLGAAGASGTVVEPRAIQAKFPLPTIHLHYRRGCSLAESFYQSVSGPYQLLIVGDPLCQPWAKPPRVEATGAEPGDLVTGDLVVTPTVLPPAPFPSIPSPLAGLPNPLQPPAAAKAANKEPKPGNEDNDEPAKRAPLVEVFVDGRLIARVESDNPLKLDTTKLPQGYHELRLVAASADAIQARSRLVLPLVFNNKPAERLKLAVAGGPTVPLDGELELVASSPKATGTVIFQHAGRELGRGELVPGAGPNGHAATKLKVKARTLGGGPVRLRAQLVAGTQAEPVWVKIR